MSIPRPEHPRMQFYRPDWVNLNGSWTFEFDFGRSGIARNRQLTTTGYDREIIVPFCPESKLSGIGYTDFIESMFYHRKLTIPAGWSGKRILLHFGAVDYIAEIYLDGKLLERHVGGSVSFEVDLTGFVEAGSTHDLVVHAIDEVRSRTQPLGKQSFQYGSSGCRYTRVSGIWQTVWLEAVGMWGLRKCRIVPEFDRGAFAFAPKFYQVQRGNTLTVRIAECDRIVAELTVPAVDGNPFSVEVPEPKSWSPNAPFLYAITFEVRDAAGILLDRVESYAGLRKVHLEGNQVYLNNEPLFQRLVLDQGYYEDGIWTAPSDEALRRDIELSLKAGFNGARLHQKVFEERFHYHADRLGYLTWGEFSSWGIDWSATDSAFYRSIINFCTEWRQVVDRDFNHPSIITWTPLNETSPHPDQQEYEQILTSVYDQTRQLDPTRPVNETSGYIHVKTDLWTVHCYRKDAVELKADLALKAGMVWRNDPRGEAAYAGQPYLVDEFGGFQYIPAERMKFAANTWGYHGLELKSPEELCAKISEQVDALLAMPHICGYCYTQLTDVEQEQNGLYNYDRTPKVPDGMLAKIFGKSR